MQLRQFITTIIIREMSQAKDKEIYEYVLEKCMRPLHNYAEEEETWSMASHASLVLHFLFKIIVVSHFQFEDFIDGFTSIFLSTELLIGLVVIDFWVTKNVLGRALIGIRWYFTEDEEGSERFMYEARINDEYTNGIFRRLFWVVQVIYVLFGYLDLIALLTIEYNIFHVSTTKIIVCAAKISGSLVNLYYFWKASNDSADRKHEMREKLGSEFVSKLAGNSLYVMM